MRRLALRRLRADDGLSLVETVVALLVFSLILTGLAASATVFVKSTLNTKVRSAAVALAQKLMEQDRAIGYSSLTNCQTGAPAGPITYNGQSMPVVTSTAGNCVTYQPPAFVSNGYTFTTKTLVLKGASAKNTAGQSVTEKFIQIIVTWSTPTTGSYELDSAVDQNDAMQADPAQGIRFDPQDSSGNSLTDANTNFDYAVVDGSGTTVASGQTDEGQQPLVSLAPGNYTCSSAENESSADKYDPGTNSGDTISTNGSNFQVISGPCTVTAGNVAIWVTVWTAVTNCSSSATKGSLNVTVKDQSNAAVSGATVQLVYVSTGSNGPTATTGTNGVASFGQTVPADLYTYTLSKSGYTTASALGPVCVPANGVSNVAGTLKGSSCPSVATKGSFQVTVDNPKGAGLANVIVSLTNQSGKANPATVKTNAQGVALFNNTVTGDSYLWGLNAPAGYTDQLNLGPVCVSPGQVLNMGTVIMYPQGQSCAVSKNKGSLSISVTDQNNAAIPNVNVTLNNLDGNGQPAAVKTNASGVALFNNNVQADLYSFTVTPPAGYLNPGIQGLPGICVVAGQVTSWPTTLIGTMTVKVTVQNQDTEPTKTYQVQLIDSGSEMTTQSVTVAQTKSGTVTFTSMPTDTYSVNVCIQNNQSGNCDSVNGLTGQVWTAINSTYSVTLPDQKGNA